MRSRFKVVVTAICTLALAITPAFAAWGSPVSTLDVSSGAMTASNAKYSDAKKIESFTLNGTFNYKNAGTDSGKNTLTPTKSALQQIVKDKLLPQWSGVAAAVFRDQADQLVDLYGYENNGGCMTKSGFDAYYNMSGSGNTKYSDEEWSCYSLKNKLAQTYSSHAGDPGWDQLTVSGVKQVASLKAVRDMVGRRSTTARITRAWKPASSSAWTRTARPGSEPSTMIRRRPLTPIS